MCIRDSCKEIKSSEGTNAVSGNYWLDSIKPGQAVLVVCDMHTGGEILWGIRGLRYHFQVYENNVIQAEWLSSWCLYVINLVSKGRSRDCNNYFVSWKKRKTKTNKQATSTTGTTATRVLYMCAAKRQKQGGRLANMGSFIRTSNYNCLMKSIKYKLKMHWPILKLPGTNQFAALSKF